MYIVQELQTNGTQIALVPTKTFEDRPHAEQAYHLACASASVSSVEVHTIMMYDEVGAVNLVTCYDRREIPEEELP